MSQSVVDWDQSFENGEIKVTESIETGADPLFLMIERMAVNRALGWNLADIKKDEIGSGHDKDLVKRGLRELRERETAAKKEGIARRKASRENGAKGGRPRAPDHADAADEFVSEKLIDDGYKLSRYYRGEWHEYLGNGWQGVNKDDIRGRLVSWMRDHEILRAHANINYSSSVMLNMAAHDLCGIEPGVQRPVWLSTGEDAKDWMAFGNGKVINIRQYATDKAYEVESEDVERKVSPDFFSPDFVPYAWVPDAGASAFEAYLARVQPDPANRAALQQMTGLLISDNTSYEAFWQLYGSGQNGKTVLLDVVKALVGSHNVSSVTLPGLIERFQSWPLAEAKVNICGELPTDVGRGQFHAIEGAFKDVVSGGMIEVEKKGADKYTAKCRARFVMATNSLPTFIDRSDGIWRRLRIIPFSQTILDSEKDVDLADHIIATDLPGVMQWAIQGLVDVIRKGNVDDCPAGAELKSKHRLGCDHEKQFLTERYRKGGENDRIKAIDIYNEYKTFMSDSGYRPCGASKFYSRVEDIFAPTQLRSLRIEMSGVSKGFDYIREIFVYENDEDL